MRDHTKLRSQNSISWPDIQPKDICHYRTDSATVKMRLPKEHTKHCIQPTLCVSCGAYVMQTACGHSCDMLFLIDCVKTGEKPEWVTQQHWENIGSSLRSLLTLGFSWSSDPSPSPSFPQSIDTGYFQLIAAHVQYFSQYLFHKG